MIRLRAFAYGLRDGWEQAVELGYSRNLDHLPGGEDDLHEWQDRGINIGQALRTGRHSQSWQERYWPFSRIPRSRWNGHWLGYGSCGVWGCRRCR